MPSVPQVPGASTVLPAAVHAGLPGPGSSPGVRWEGSGFGPRLPPPQSLWECSDLWSQELQELKMTSSVAPYEQLVRQVEALKAENSHLRQELRDNSSHLSKLETETSGMKVWQGAGRRTGTNARALDPRDGWTGRAWGSPGQ